MENKTSTYTVLMANVEKFHNTVLRSDIVKLANQIDQANSEGQLEPLVMPKPTHWLKLKLTEMLVELENRVDRHNSSSWIVNNDALQEYKDGIIYIKKLLS